MPGRGRGQQRGGGPHRRWGRRTRVLEPMLLLLVAEQPAHGYGLVERLGKTFGMAELPPQTIYRALQQMEESGWLTPDWDMDSGQGPPRKVYQITPVGEAALETWSEEMGALRQMLNTFLIAYQRFRNS